MGSGKGFLRGRPRPRPLTALGFFSDGARLTLLGDPLGLPLGLPDGVDGAPARLTLLGDPLGLPLPLGLPVHFSTTAFFLGRPRVSFLALTGLSVFFTLLGEPLGLPWAWPGRPEMKLPPWGLFGVLGFLNRTLWVGLFLASSSGVGRVHVWVLGASGPHIPPSWVYLYPSWLVALLARPPLELLLHRQAARLPPRPTLV